MSVWCPVWRVTSRREGARRVGPVTSRRPEHARGGCWASECGKDGYPGSMASKPILAPDSPKQPPSWVPLANRTREGPRAPLCPCRTSRLSARHLPRLCSGCRGILGPACRGAPCPEGTDRCQGRGLSHLWAPEVPSRLLGDAKGGSPESQPGSQQPQPALCHLPPLRHPLPCVALLASCLPLAPWSCSSTFLRFLPWWT